MLRVDSFRKVTVSLGGVCTLACHHCYTMTRVFIHEPSRSVGDVLDELSGLPEPYRIICVSGDTDCFIEASAGLELLRRLIECHSDAVVMFTTRLIPPERIVDGLINLGQICRERCQLFIPCVSVITHSYPNALEDPKRIPSTVDRLAFLRTLSKAGLPGILAMRPTFPFTVVSKEEVTGVLNEAIGVACVVLGEALLLDGSGQLAKRLRLPLLQDSDSIGPMSFLDQPSVWHKRLHVDEIAWIRSQSAARGMPFYLRSPSAIALLQDRWEFSTSSLSVPMNWQEYEVSNVLP